MNAQLMSGLTKLPETQETIGALGGLGNSMQRTQVVLVPHVLFHSFVLFRFHWFL